MFISSLHLLKSISWIYYNDRNICGVLWCQSIFLVKFFFVKHQEPLLLIVDPFTRAHPLAILLGFKFNFCFKLKLQMEKRLIQAIIFIRLLVQTFNATSVKRKTATGCRTCLKKWICWGLITKVGRGKIRILNSKCQF